MMTEKSIKFMFPLIAVLLLVSSLAACIHTNAGGVAEATGKCEASNSGDICSDREWGISRIDAPRAWQIAEGNSDTIVAVLDTGIDQTHIDLAGKIIANVNFTQSPTVGDVHGHGTHIAGIIGAIANNDTGIAGLAYNCSLMNVKVADDSGFCDAAVVAEGIVWAVDNGAKVINISLTIAEPNQALEDAVNYAWDQGAVIVAALGNYAGEKPMYPACYPECIAVAATDADDCLCFGSKYSDYMDVAAPGVDIYSTLPDNKYGLQSGNSMATAYVSALAGLLMSLQSDTDNDGLLNAEVLDTIRSSCDDIGTREAGSGRINVLRAVTEAADCNTSIEN